MKASISVAFSAFLLMGCLPWLTDQGEAEPTEPPPANSDLAFLKDNATVFLADFEGKAVNSVTGDPGTVTGASYPKAVFGNGLKLETRGFGKGICLFPATDRLSLAGGSLEALVRLDSISMGFNHILDKHGQYALSVYDGKIAAHFGGEWWHSSEQMPKGKWTYVAVVVDDGFLKLFVNGDLTESTLYEGGTGSSAHDLGIGNASDASKDVPFPGILDAIRISKSPRTASEISKTWKGIEKKIAG